MATANAVTPRPAVAKMPAAAPAVAKMPAAAPAVAKMPAAAPPAPTMMATPPAAAAAPKAAAAKAPVLTPAPVDPSADTPNTEAAKPTRKRQRTDKGTTATTPVTTDASATPGEEKAESNNGSWLIVAKSVRTLLKNMPENIHCSADALPALNAKVQEMIQEAAARAAGNSRKTLKSYDF